MDPTLSTHLLLQQRVDHTMSRRLHFRLEGVGGYRHTINRLVLLS